MLKISISSISSKSQLAQLAQLDQLAQLARLYQLAQLAQLDQLSQLSTVVHLRMYLYLRLKIMNKMCKEREEILSLSKDKVLSLS